MHDRGGYIGRYGQIMRRLANDGYAVFGHDQMGHGRTAEKFFDVEAEQVFQDMMRFLNMICCQCMQKK